MKIFSKIALDIHSRDKSYKNGIFDVVIRKDSDQPARMHMRSTPFLRALYAIARVPREVGIV